MAKTKKPYWGCKGVCEDAQLCQTYGSQLFSELALCFLLDLSSGVWADSHRCISSRIHPVHGSLWFEPVLTLITLLWALICCWKKTAKDTPSVWTCSSWVLRHKHTHHFHCQEAVSTSSETCSENVWGNPGGLIVSYKVIRWHSEDRCKNKQEKTHKQMWVLDFLRTEIIWGRCVSYLSLVSRWRNHGHRQRYLHFLYFQIEKTKCTLKAYV